MLENQPQPAGKTFEQQYLALAATNFLLTFSASCYSIFLGSFFSSLHIPGKSVGYIGAVGSAALVIGNLFWGYISDLTGRRRLLIIVGGVISVPALLLWLAGSSNADYAGLSAAYNFIVAPTIALVSVFVLDLLPAQSRATRFAAIKVWGSLGLLTASWGAGWFLKPAPNRIFIFAAVTALLALVPLIAGTHEVVRPRVRRFHFRHVMANRSLLLFFLCTFLHGFWQPACFLFLSYSLKQQHASEGSIGIILGLNGLVAMVSFPVAGRMADRWGRRPMLLLMFLLTGLRMFLYSVISNPWGYLPVQLLHFGSFGISEGVGSVYVAELADERDRASAVACFHIFLSIGATVGSLVGGYLSGEFGFPMMYRVFAVVMCVAALLFSSSWWRPDRGIEPLEQEAAAG